MHSFNLRPCTYVRELAENVADQPLSMSVKCQPTTCTDPCQRQSRKKLAMEVKKVMNNVLPL